MDRVNGMHLNRCLLPAEIEEQECSDGSLTESFEVDVVKASNSLDDSIPPLSPPMPPLYEAQVSNHN